jgi:aminotransferase EvaB
MNLPSIALSLPSRQLSGIADQITEAINDVVASGWWLKGEHTQAFEEEFAAYCGAPFCLGVANGTDGLELALRAVGAANHEVITVANAGGYTTTACRLVGATPSYVDIDPIRLAMDVEAAIAAVTPKTRAVVATHLFGNVVDVGALRSGLVGIDRADISIVEDGSQAHGARLGGDIIHLWELVQRPGDGHDEEHGVGDIESDQGH